MFNILVTIHSQSQQIKKNDKNPKGTFIELFISETVSVYFYHFSILYNLKYCESMSFS